MSDRPWHGVPDAQPVEFVDPSTLIGARDVLQICGWQTRKSIADAHGFPDPVAVVSGARLWTRPAVLAWHQDRRSR